MRTRTRTRALTAALALVVAGGLLVAAVPATAQSAPGEALTVTLDEDGSADVALRLTFDLSDDDRREAFQSLRDETTRERRAQAFESRMTGVADAITASTGRTASAGNTSVDLRTVDRTGVVELSTTVDGFAAVADERLTVDVPFAGGFTTDRPLVIVPPEGYEATTTPEPDASGSGDRLRWDAGRDLSGFTATFEPADAGASAPGFGVVGALCALGAGTALALYTRH